MAKVAMLTLTTAVDKSDARVFKEARTLQRAGYKVQVIGKRGDYPIAFETIDGLKVWRVDTTWIHETASNLKAKLRQHFIRFIVPFHSGYAAYYCEVYKLIREDRVDIYHAHDLATLPVAVLCKRRFGGKIVYDCHEVWLFRNRLPKRSKWNILLMWLLEFLLVRFTDAVLTTSEGHTKLMRKLYLVKPVEVFNASPWQNVNEVKVLREKLRFPDREKIVLYLGYLTYGRGLEESIKAMNHVDAHCHLVLLGYGEQDYIESLRALALQEGVEDRLRFFPPVPYDRVVEHASSANVGIAAIKDCCLSYRACFPNKLLEYIAAEIPVAVSDLPELKKAVAKYQIGAVFNPDRPEEIAAALNQVLMKEPEYKENVRLAKKDFTWEKESEKLLMIYGRLDG